MRPSRNRGALENYRYKAEITVIVIEIHVHRDGAGSVFIHLKTSFTRGTWRKDFDSKTLCTFCDQTDVRGNVDGGVDDARLVASHVKELREGAVGACASEVGEVERQKM